MDHLIFEARELAIEIRESKKPSKHVDLLFLHVHKDNIVAQKVYERFEFERLPDFDENDMYVMAHKLDWSEKE